MPFFLRKIPYNTCICFFHFSLLDFDDDDSASVSTDEGQRSGTSSPAPSSSSSKRKKKQSKTTGTLRVQELKAEARRGKKEKGSDKEDGKRGGKRLKVRFKGHWDIV